MFLHFKMNKTPLVLMMLFAAIPIMWGQPRNQAEEIRVILSSSQTTHIHDVAPEATFAFVANTLQVTLDATHYASYSVTLTAPAGDSVTVNATTPTVTIPVTAGDAYVVTVDGGDYGTYDGVFSRTGAATVTLSDRQALRLAQNRRTGNSGVNFYSATVPAVINDSLRCPVPTPPAQAWATDTGVEKWLLFVDERPDWGWAHECTYIYAQGGIRLIHSPAALRRAGHKALPGRQHGHEMGQPRHLGPQPGRRPGAHGERARPAHRRPAGVCVCARAQSGRHGCGAGQKEPEALCVSQRRAS